MLLNRVPRNPKRAAEGYPDLLADMISYPSAANGIYEFVEMHDDGEANFNPLYKHQTENFWIYNAWGSYVIAAAVVSDPWADLDPIEFAYLAGTDPVGYYSDYGDWYGEPTTVSLAS